MHPNNNICSSGGRTPLCRTYTACSLDSQKSEHATNLLPVQECKRVHNTTA